MFRPLAGDRPGSVVHEYRGERLIIAPRWRNGPAPTGIVISPATQPTSRAAGTLVVYDMLVGEWESYWDAIDAGIAAAEAFVDAHWVDD